MGSCVRIDARGAVSGPTAAKRVRQNTVLSHTDCVREARRSLQPRHGQLKDGVECTDTLLHHVGSVPLGFISAHHRTAAARPRDEKLWKQRQWEEVTVAIALPGKIVARGAASLPAPHLSCVGLTSGGHYPPAPGRALSGLIQPPP